MQLIALTKSEHIIDMLLDASAKKIVNSFGRLPSFSVTSRPFLDRTKKQVFIGDNDLFLSDTIKEFLSHDSSKLVILSPKLSLGSISHSMLFDYAKPSQVVFIGTARYHADEYNYAKEHKLTIFPISEIMVDGIETVCESIMYSVKNAKSLMFVLDYSFIASSVSSLDSSSFSTSSKTAFLNQQLLDRSQLLHLLYRMKNIRSFNHLMFMVGSDNHLSKEGTFFAAQLIYDLS